MITKQIRYSSYVDVVYQHIYFADVEYKFLIKHNVKVFFCTFEQTIKNNSELFYFKNVLDFVFPSEKEYAEFKLRFMK